MTMQLRMWTSLGLAALAGAAAAQAATAGDVQPLLAKHPAQILLAQAAGEGGEGGEGGGAILDLDDEIDYLADLGQVEGHMTVGIELYKLGAKNAAVHMKHPADELYASLRPAFEARKVAGFAKELEAVSAGVEAGKPVAEVEAALVELIEAVRAARGRELDAATTVRVVHRLMRVAAEEYAEGVKDGKVVDAKEYQDAWGFTEVARKMIAELPRAERAEHAGAIGDIEAAIAAVKPAWTEIVGTQPVTADPHLLAITAAKIELAAYEVK